MKSTRNIIVLLAMLAMLSIVGCSRENLPGRAPSEHEDLLGRAVDFDVTVSDFVQTKLSTGVNHNGQLNLYDEMHIYRQYYSEDRGVFYWPKPSKENAPGALYWLTGVVEGRDVPLAIWKPKVGASFSFTYNDIDGIEQTYTIAPQTEKDSLTWENGETVRFRAWALSHFEGYDDYMVSNWVTASGPTKEIHIDFHHPGCRIGFDPYGGNTFSRVEISLDLNDYSEEFGDEAAAKLALVQTAYNKMRKPSLRVDHDDFSYEAALDAEGNTIRPSFVNVGGRRYLISMPHDEDGMPIVIPECTLFKIYLYDVNDGDKAQTGNEESTYHIINLGKICKLDAGGNITDVLAFPDGIEMEGGRSYLITVGYRYNNLTVTAADNFSWVLQDIEATSGDDKREALLDYDATNSYAWFKDALNEASEEAQRTAVFEPKFHLKTVQDVREFVTLVNGITLYNTDYEEDPLIYTQYHPLEGTVAAHTTQDTLVTPFSFYSYSVLKRLSVYLDNDIDMQDWEIGGIGNTDTTPFEGYFDGQGHTLKNLNVVGESLFGTVKEGVIRNLKIESTHPLRLVGTCKDEQILCCSVKAPSTGNSIAVSAKGSCAFVACSHEGSSTGALVGTAENLIMMGCLQASDALSGAAFYGTGKTTNEDFIANYYDLSLSPGAVPVSGKTLDSYDVLEYIRGYKTYLLRALEDNLLTPKLMLELTPAQQKNYYGAAPWKAMNYAIHYYNTNLAGKFDRCSMHYEVNETGYDHRYPVLVSAEPTDAQYVDLSKVLN